MISGFNTDIEHNGTVYHVQTEDKGRPKRMIMSLVYDRGTILASKRVNYEEIDEKELAARVGRQHKLICAAVQAGRLDELKKMSAKVPPSVPGLSPTPQTDKPITKNAEADRTPLKLEFIEPLSATDIASAGPIIDAVSVIEEENMLPADAVAVVSELSGQDRPSHNKLSLELLGDTKFKGGDRRTVNLMICRGTARKVVAGAQILVKVLGSSFRPVIFHAKSDLNGLAKIHLQLPHFQAGRAALLVRVLAEGEEVELRRAVTPG